MKRAIPAWGFNGIAQSNHLAPVGLFGKIPQGQGLAIPLAGSINDIGSQHWRYHATIDNAVSYGNKYGSPPTVGKFIDDILPDALQNAGIDPATAYKLSELSELQILGYYSRSDVLPNVLSGVKFPQ
jgi:hypothetical protein